MKDKKCPDSKAGRIEASTEIAPGTCAAKDNCATGASSNKNKKASKNK